MSWRRPKTSGWAAFDQQQKQKDVLDSRVSSEAFPSLPGTMYSFEKSERNNGNKHSSVKPFSSVVVPSFDFPTPVQDNKTSLQSEVDNSGGSKRREVPTDSGFGEVVRQLKALYSWADDSLIEDIMVAVGNDFDMASSFLQAMVSDETLKDHKNAKVAKSVDLASNGRKSHERIDLPVQTVCEAGKACSSLKACVDNGDGNGRNEFDFQAGKLLDAGAQINAMLGKLTCIPVEPEWEEDDVYLSCRKDAIKMIRAASRHSKAATNFFLKGDHFSAQQYSLKAQEEWETANRLNMKAAREILSIRNENNGIWRLDLHGLHATEAVQALQEHLHMIETQLYFKGSNTVGVPNDYRTRAEALCASEEQLGRQNQKWLEVITGIGNHSRGGAALPIAVKTFLTDNGYRTDEARPGVIMVRPKFRSN